jgi:hypothetical protein
LRKFIEVNRTIASGVSHGHKFLGLLESHLLTQIHNELFEFRVGNLAILVLI